MDSPVSWEGCPQHQPNDNARYGIVDNAVMVPYNPRACACGPVQRPAMPPQIFTANSYNSTSLTNTWTSGPSYHATNPFSANSAYGHLSTVHHPQFQEQYQIRPQLPTIAGSPPGQDRNVAQPQGAGVFYEDASHTALAKVERSPARIGSARVETVPKTITSTATGTRKPVLPVNGAGEVEPYDPVDDLLRVIQSKPDIDFIVQKSEKRGVGNDQDRPVESDLARLVLAQAPLVKQKGRPRAKKLYYCSFEGCGKICAHKTQLTAHLRVHTGEKPFPCTWPGCDQWFSQKTNRDTHLRVHTGEKPYPCPECGKRFPQRGNVKPHMLTHRGYKGFPCKVDNCNRVISTRGNLKSHMRHFHADTLKALTERLSHNTDIASAYPADREMAEYMGLLFKNLNKGIKGCKGSRGRKSRQATPTTPAASPVSTAMATPASSVFYHSAQHSPFASPMQPVQHGLPMNNAGCYYYGISHPASYSLSHRNIMANDSIHIDIDMHDADSDGTANNAASPTSTATYDDEQEQRVVFGHRIF